MTTTIRTAAMLAMMVCAAATASGAAPGTAADEDPIMKAMTDEMARYRALRVESLEPAYYLDATVDEVESFDVSASFGALEHRGDDTVRTASVNVRVGSPALDNTNFSDSEHRSFGGAYLANMLAGPVPADTDYDALRQALWLRIDSAYKGSVEELSRKRAYLETNAVTDRPADFSPAAVPSVILPRAKLLVDRARWTNLVKTASAVFRADAPLSNGTAYLHASAINQVFVSSESARDLFGDTPIRLILDARMQAADGMEVFGRIDLRGRSEDDLPKDAEVVAAAHQLAARVLAVSQAPVLPNDYSGPVLFTGRAAAEFFLATVGVPLSNAREVLGEPRQGRLVDRLGTRIASPLLTVRDDPTQQKWHGKSLLGYFPFDDEGVKPQPTTLVSKGVLKNYYMSRVPTRDFAKTNGHARGSSASVGNLFVDAAQPLPRAVMKKKLLAMIKSAGLPSGLLVEDTSESRGFRQSAFMGGGDEAGGDIQLPAPTVAYRVFPDGREELVRGAVFKPATFRVLDDIVALGNDPVALNTEADGQDVGVVAPSVLVRQLEVKRPAREFDKPPAVERPVASKSAAP